MDILIGADPEVFVKRSGVFVSGHDLIRGTKREPFVVPDGAVQVDGMALEFNITPARTADEFVHNIHSVYRTLSGMIPPGDRLVASPVAMFDKNYYDGLPISAKERGCDPDFDAWTGEENPRPESLEPIWTGAGHIHLGWTEGRDPNDPSHIEDCHAVIQQMDYFIGLPSLRWDPDDTRRKLYGRAGAHRRKPYGVEYRTPSNRWLSSPELIRYVFDSAREGLRQMEAGDWKPKYFGDMAKDWINGNVTPDRGSMDYFGLKLPPELKDFEIRV